RRVVLEPDYLVSVTTVAECLQRDGAVPELALVNAFLPDEASRSMVIGNLVNALLDEEVREAAAGRDLDFDVWVRTRLFRQNPLQISALAEFNEAGGVQKLIDELRRQHLTLRAVRTAGFVPPARESGGYQHAPLRPEHCFLEPSFFSARYGLQGRLDLLHESATGYDLVELKSSAKVPGTGAWENHRAQAQLYRLLLETVDGGAESAEPSRGRTSILYSNAEGGAGAIRPVTADATFVDRLLMARNALVARELMLALCRTPAQTEQLLRPVLHPSQYKLPPFTAPKAEKIANAWAEADDVERAYALELVRFAARELRVCLLGDGDARPGDVGGQAGPWTLPDTRKTQNFSLLDHLTLLADHSNDEAEPHLLFQRPTDGAEVNFRAGDSLLLYPRRRAASVPPLLTPLDSQVVKVALEEITPDTVRLSVRNRRIAPEYLTRHAIWALEPDCYDTFRREWAGVSAFLGRPRAQRQLLLGRAAPRLPADWLEGTSSARTADDVVARALAAPDWFLLCGPPGTGKTRSVLR
ncbi:MAG: PD-(D/E)XK nuclease family protein, partial [Hymenobacteraceae bacterium]|nr:PD-(D/E)XK nuclease family protein [Hymenobacteraceae bacterium]